MNRARILLIAKLLLLTCLLPAFGSLAQATSPEYQIKAAFLLKFPAYVEWPKDVFPNETDPLIFGVVDSTEMYESLQAVAAGQLLAGRSIEVRQLRPDMSVSGVNVLFIGGTGQSAAVTLSAVAGLPVLTVTDSSDEQPTGSMINFAIVDDRVRFDVTLAATEHAGLKLSSRLLQVARKVVGAP